MLSEEISAAQRLVRTDAYQMSIGEIVSMYESEEIVVDPEFQRLFRWTVSQKSKLIESILLGIPLPSIFIYEQADGKWELVDGLQRVSTILEFMGRLRDPDGGIRPPSSLEATSYLPSLTNVVWSRTEEITEPNVAEQQPLDRSYQLAIRRARIGVEILKRPSDDQTKFDLFQRLNAGGTPANSQELRNCIMLMVNKSYFRSIKIEAERADFKNVISPSEDQLEKQRHLEFATRFLVYTLQPYDGVLDVEDYIDKGIINLSERGRTNRDTSLLRRTFTLLNSAAGSNALRRYDGRRYVGKVGLVALEGIAVGVARNIEAIEALPDSQAFVSRKAEQFWQQAETSRFTSPGLRGTTRIQRTIPFGERWFAP